MYSASEAGQAAEHQETYLKTVFGFLGITDLRAVRAEGIDMGPDGRTRALQVAADTIRTLIVHH